MERTKLNKVSLIDLLQKLDIDQSSYSFCEQITINNLCDDSRKVSKGDFFVAISCDRVASNVEEALKKGAKVILATPDVISLFSSNNSVLLIAYPNPRIALSILAKTFYGVQPNTLMAVTGTNGKTSTVSIVRQLWELLGYSAVSFGTMGVVLTKQALSKKSLLPQMPSDLNTYDSLSFFHLLQSLAQAEINHAVFEASSIGLDQFRIHGAQLEVAGFTNFTQDHLDYHHTMEDYFQAKVKLFSEVLPSGKTAVLNSNSPYLEQLKAIVVERNIQVLTYAINLPADIYATRLNVQATNLTFDLHYQGKTYFEVALNLNGAFQLENTLCAMGMLMASGISLAEILPVLPKVKSVEGRMELIGQTSNGGCVYIDYAHTPDALERALKSLRTHTEKSIWIVFGCGGDRDTLKRPQMGKIASELADKVIITDDNPRNEDPTVIRKQILNSCPASLEIADRREAIEYAIAHLEKGDTLLIAGKGHETGQIVGEITYPFNDAQEARDSLARLR